MGVPFSSSIQPSSLFTFKKPAPQPLKWDYLCSVVVSESNDELYYAKMLKTNKKIRVTQAIAVKSFSRTETNKEERRWNDFASKATKKIILRKKKRGKKLSSFTILHFSCVTFIVSPFKHWTFLKLVVSWSETLVPILISYKKFHIWVFFHFSLIL